VRLVTLREVKRGGLTRGAGGYPKCYLVGYPLDYLVGYPLGYLGGSPLGYLGGYPMGYRGGYPRDYRLGYPCGVRASLARNARLAAKPRQAGRHCELVSIVTGFII